jgi:hypothetical protein
LKIAGAHRVPFERQRAYDLLQDPAVLARAMPGCDQLNRVGPDEYEMKMKMASASIQGLFAGKVRLADQNPPESFRLVVEGSGKVGFVKGDGLLTLVPGDAGTEVRYEGDVQVGGMIAGVGQRLIENAARMVIKRFFEKFSEAGQTAGSGLPTA